MRNRSAPVRLLGCRVVAVYPVTILCWQRKRHGKRATRLNPGSASGMTLRPSFTAILWGCSMPLWPRILQHIQSRIDGKVTVAKMQLPAEVYPFLEAVCALLPRPHTCSAHPSTPLSALTAVCDYARCRQVRQAISDKQSISHRKKNRPSPHKAMLKPRWLTLCGSVFGGFFWR